MVTGNGVSHGLVVTGRFIGCHVVLPHLIVVMVVVLCIVSYLFGLSNFLPTMYVWSPGLQLSTFMVARNHVKADL